MDPLTRIAQDLLDLADFGYGRLRSRLRGLTDEEYRWEPASGCWSIRLMEDGRHRLDGSRMPPRPAPLTTIAWRLCHLIGGLAEERNATWLGVIPAGRLERDGEPSTAADAIAQLERAYALFRAHVAAADPASLTTPMGPIAEPFADHTRAAFILHELDELIHHGAEIGTMRDLYRATRQPPSLVEAAQRADRAAVAALLDADPDLPARYPEMVAQLAAEEQWAGVRLLLDLGFDVNASAGISALHYAAGAGELAVVKDLAARGADPVAKDVEFDQPPAGWARQSGHLDVAAYLEAL